MAKIGFIGTGIMGKPMAQNLQNAGHTLFFSEHFDKAPADLLGNNGIGLANPREVAQEAEFIIIMVPDTPQVEDVLFRADGVAAGVGAGKVVIDMSSISPTATKQFAEKIKATGAAYLDAPVSGGEVGAKALGIEFDVLAIARPVARRSAGDAAFFGIRQGIRQNRQAGVIEFSTDLGALADFDQVAKEAKAGDVGHRMHTGQAAEGRTRRVELRRRGDHRRVVVCRQYPLFERRAVKANAKALAENQLVAGLGAGIAANIARMDEADGDEAVNRLD